MFRSISRQLQFSYGLLLLIALVGLGMFGFQYRKSEMLNRIDEGLQIRSRQINSMLVRYDLNGFANAKGAEDSSEIPSLPPLPDLPVDDDVENPQSPLYYKIWKVEEGALELIFQSAESPELIDPIPLPREIRETGILKMDGEDRQIFSRAVRSYVILVGATISDQKKKLNQFLIRIILWEAAFLAFFVLIGSWLTKRALSPLGQISETARTIADGALDQRIPVEAGSSELQDLSLVLNDSFDHLEGSILRQREFTSNASHELRTPITAILAEGQSKPETIDDYRKSLDHCVDTARSMGQLVDQLLDMARFDSGNVELQRDATDLDILVSRAVQMIRPAAEKKSIQIESDLDLIQADVNSVRITQVVINLLKNAVSYTGEGGRIQVRLSETEDTVEIAVEDNGVGISYEDLPNIFNRFYRADKSRSEHENNHFGLGLAISREIAAGHGGDLRVESEMGKGSAFVLSLPRVTA